MTNTTNSKKILTDILKIVCKAIAGGLLVIGVCFFWLALVAVMAKIAGPIGFIYAIGIAVFLALLGFGFYERHDSKKEKREEADALQIKL
jgi:hypothetical protein